MKHKKTSLEQGNVLICTLCTILIISLIGANVLQNCTTRFNVATSQVRSWKESLFAAEAGGEIGYAEIRKKVLDPLNQWPVPGATLGWINTGPVTPQTPKGTNHVLHPDTTFGSSNLTAGTVVEECYVDPITKLLTPVDATHPQIADNPWYRSRSRGTAPVMGLRRTGLDDRMGAGTRGDSLLRKIDFNTDHFIATYGPNGDGVGQTLVPVLNPQVTRRIEQISAPVTPFEAAIKCTGTFYGLGDAAMIDSYSSKNGTYYFAANNPSDPHFSDSRSGSVEINTAVATVRGMLYGNVSTNGGTIVRSSQITGTIDNNVPFTVPPFAMPTNLPPAQPSPTTVTSTVTITPPATGTAASPTYYLLSSLSGKLIINPFGSAPTYVAIHVTNDVTGQVDVKSNVHVKVFFNGNMDLKARDINNETGLAANLQFYGVSPSDPSTVQTIHISPPGDFAAAFYAPSADFTMNGNPDVTGAIVCKTFYGNGNTTWHYDRALDTEGDAVDYRIVSYVEDIR